MKYFTILILCFVADLVGAQLRRSFVYPDDDRLSTVTTAPRAASDKSPARLTGVISRQKCEEYKKLTKKSDFYRGLSLLGSTIEIKRTECDAYSGLVVGGDDAKENQFPHMAAIGYRGSGSSVSFGCGGSLISDRFILTAAHCNATQNTKPSFVRLGEHDLSKLSGNEKDYEIEDFIQHPDYNIAMKKNDIALIKLKTPVTFNKTSIFPACLDQIDNVPKENATASGWGFQSHKGFPADILQKVVLDILPCQNNSTYESQICAGVKNLGNGEKEKDTCDGDSGGPLQVTTKDNNCVFDIIGIVSYGSRLCGSEPGIYTRVASYIGWIESVVWP